MSTLHNRNSRTQFWVALPSWTSYIQNQVKVMVLQSATCCQCANDVVVSFLQVSIKSSTIIIAFTFSDKTKLKTIDCWQPQPQRPVRACLIVLCLFCLPKLQAKPDNLLAIMKFITITKKEALTKQLKLFWIWGFIIIMKGITIQTTKVNQT
jgi:hypothetical protein